MADDNWYYTMSGQQQGPVPLAHLQHWLTQGNLQPTELVWRDGMPTWIAANQVPELQAYAPAAPTYPSAQVGYSQPMGYVPGNYAQAAAIQSQKSKATTALVLGIVGLLCCGFAGIAAIIYANMAMGEMKRSGSDEGKGMAIAGMILGILACVAMVGMLALNLSKMKVWRMTEDNWYYAVGGQQQGPVALAVLRGWLGSGQLQSQDMVWREGMPSWLAVGSVPELADAVPAATQTWNVGGAAAGLGYQNPAQMNYYSPGLQAAYAGFWIRFLAALVDGIIISAPFTILGMIVQGGLTPQQQGPPSPEQAVLSLVINLASIVAGWLYEALQTSGPHMGTLGKRMMGIRVTDMYGQRISFGRATGRHFAKIISGCILLIGYIMQAFTERRQALHDMIAGTLVVQGAAPK